MSLIRVSESFMIQRVMSRFSVENFLCHSTEPFLRGTLLCCVSEKFWQRKSLWITRGGGGEDQNFLSKTFCLTVPKNFVGEPFSVSLISAIEKFYASEGYVTIFVEIFCLAVPKNFVGEPFSVSLISGIGKILCSRGLSHVFSVEN